MIRRLFFACLLAPGIAVAAPFLESNGGGSAPLPDPAACLTEAQHAAIKARIDAVLCDLQLSAEPAVPPLLGWPLRRSGTLHHPGFHGISNFVDQNGANPGSILDYNCGPRTYDIQGYNHQGIDLFTWPFAWYRMANDQVQVVAAAPGTIIGKDDGNADQSCAFGSGNWNAVYIRHADNSVAWYGHLKRLSLTSKGVGASVAEGEYLGIVGSSGNSTGPHLHFELYNSQGNLVDPFEGPCNSLNATGWWRDQPPYYDSALNALMTHDAPPNFPPCPGVETTNQDGNFQPGETAYFAAYYRDQLQGQVTTFRVRRPNGTIYTEWTGASNDPYYTASYWYWYFPLPGNAPLGRWRFEATYEGSSTSIDFFVTTATAAPTTGGAALALRSVVVGSLRVDVEASIPREGEVSVNAFDARGRLVSTLARGAFGEGTHRIAWHAPGRGVYFLRLEHEGSHTETKVVVSG